MTRDRSSPMSSGRACGCVNMLSGRTPSPTTECARPVEYPAQEKWKPCVSRVPVGYAITQWPSRHAKKLRFAHKARRGVRINSPLCTCRPLRITFEDKVSYARPVAFSHNPTGPMTTTNFQLNVLLRSHTGTMPSVISMACGTARERSSTCE